MLSASHSAIDPYQWYTATDRASLDLGLSIQQDRIPPDPTGPSLPVARYQTIFGPTLGRDLTKKVGICVGHWYMYQYVCVEQWRYW